MARYVYGLENVLRNIARELALVEGATLSGMMKAMYFLYQETETTNPVTPLSNKDKVHMRDTWYVVPYKKAFVLEVRAGYTAPYAPIVHENLKAVNWTRPGSGPKWLQIHWDRNRTEMLMIVAQNARAATGGVSFVNVNKRTNERNVEF